MNDQRTDGVWRRGRESNRKRGTNEKEPVQTMWRGGGVGGRMGRRPLDRPTCTALNVTIKTGMKTGRSVTSYKGTKHTGGEKKEPRLHASRLQRMGYLSRPPAQCLTF